MSWFLVLVVVVMSVKYACINEVCVGKAEKERERERENNISLAFFLSFFFDTTYNFGRVSTLEPF